MERRWCRLAPTVGGSWASRSSPAAKSSGGQARGRGDDTRSRQLDVERGVYRGHQLSDSHSSSDHGRRSPFCWHEPYSPEAAAVTPTRSEEHTSELQSLMRLSYAVSCLKKKHINNQS